MKEAEHIAETGAGTVGVGAHGVGARESDTAQLSAAGAADSGNPPSNGDSLRAVRDGGDGGLQAEDADRYALAFRPSWAPLTADTGPEAAQREESEDIAAAPANATRRRSGSRLALSATDEATGLQEDLLRVPLRQVRSKALALAGLSVLSFFALVYWGISSTATSPAESLARSHRPSVRDAPPTPDLAVQPANETGSPQTLATNTRAGHMKAVNAPTQPSPPTATDTAALETPALETPALGTAEQTQTAAVRDEAQAGLEPTYQRDQPLAAQLPQDQAAPEVPDNRRADAPATEAQTATQAQGPMPTSGLAPPTEPPEVVAKTAITQTNLPSTRAQATASDDEASEPSPAPQPAPRTPEPAVAASAASAIEPPVATSGSKSATADATRASRAPSSNAPAVAKPRPPLLVVRAVPEGTQLWLDGQRMSNPFDTRLPLGSKHKLDARHAGYEASSQTIRLESDARLTITLRRASPPPTPHIKVRPLTDRPRGAGFVTTNPY